MRTPASGPLFTHRLNTRNDSQKKKKPKLQPALRTNCKDEKLITTSVTPRHERLMPRTFSQSVRASSWRCSYRHWLSPDSTFRMFADKIFWLHWKHINDRTKKKKKKMNLIVAFAPSGAMPSAMIAWWTNTRCIVFRDHPFFHRPKFRLSVSSIVSNLTTSVRCRLQWKRRRRSREKPKTIAKHPIRFKGKISFLCAIS